MRIIAKPNLSPAGFEETAKSERPRGAVRVRRGPSPFDRVPAPRSSARLRAGPRFARWSAQPIASALASKSTLRRLPNDLHDAPRYSVDYDDDGSVNDQNRIGPIREAVVVDLDG